MTDIKSKYLVTSTWLSEHVNDENLVIVDCVWDSNAYIRAHIPNAIMRPGHSYIKSDNNGQPDKFLPNEEEFLTLMESLGINSESTVICYDEWDNHFATRLWWVLKYYGHKNVRLVDGGWQAWVESGLPISIENHNAKKRDEAFKINIDDSILVKMDQILDNLENPDWQVIDARSEVEFKGINQHINKRAGHIPNAFNLEWNKLLNKTANNGANFFQSKEEMIEQFNALGIDKDKTIVVHCQAGIRASFTHFCLDMIGYQNVKLYDASMYEWANEYNTPLESN